MILHLVIRAVCVRTVKMAVLVIKADIVLAVKDVLHKLVAHVSHAKDVMFVTPFVILAKAAIPVRVAVTFAMVDVTAELMTQTQKDVLQTHVADVGAAILAANPANQVVKVAVKAVMVAVKAHAKAARAHVIQMMDASAATPVLVTIAILAKAVIRVMTNATDVIPIVVATAMQTVADATQMMQAVADVTVKMLISYVYSLVLLEIKDNESSLLPGL